MSIRLTAAAPWLLAALSGAAGFAQLPSAFEERVPVAVPPTTRSRTEPLRSNIDLLSVWKGAPFRSDRTPPADRYDTTAPVEPEAPASVPPWRLAGVVMGAPPVAVFEELPDHGGAIYLLSEGDRVGPYVVGAIRGDSVVMHAGRERWSFRLEADWQ